VSGTRAPIVQERVLAATPEEVFAAWSDPESLRAWMCPGDVRRAEAQVDFRVGGRFRIVMYGREAYSHHGEYLEIDPPRRLVFTWVSEFLPEAVSRTRVSVTFTRLAAGGTRLRLVHEALPAGDWYAGHEQGWSDILARLDEVLRPGATVPGPPGGKP
jgi:uncharacterized protein YndB with AHSA1/START domain